MIRTSHLLSLVAIASFSSGLSPASAQSHGLAARNELQRQASVKSLQPQILGLADKSHLLDSKAGAVAGLNSVGDSKSVALRNGVGHRIENPKPLKNRVLVNHHPGQSVWATAFDDIDVQQELSQGKLPTDQSFLRERLFSKRSPANEASHGLTGSHWSGPSKDAEGLH